MFAKPLKNFASEFELSEEEKEAIEKSKQQLGGRLKSSCKNKNLDHSVLSGRYRH
jgi:hypothetical protein